MKNNNLPIRKAIRLQNFDYSQNGAYFITICTKDKKHLLGSFEEDSNLVLTKIGENIAAEIHKLSKIYMGIYIDKYVIMPNHIHMILIIGRGELSSPDRPTISRIIKQFKGSITKQVGYSIWQKSFYDHVIRNEKDYLVRWKYIDDNPIKWIYDEYHTL